ncbi:phasin family protein [Paraburkholderia caribensis MBA4]|uniref:Phasin family protein n=1 Tax=Paraburkholderia caribensis MBA4 TaxID=1323664 RepID=A0A0P0RK06_9BURK|nr:TIGR01841 family phasin [Paraburkholderia caribensis]ALL69086.1 phasin family protein [Paraburkholderia caribensis MBA4]
MSESLIALPNDAADTVREHDAWPANPLIDLAQLCVETAGRIAELNSKAIHASLDEQQAVALEAANEYSLLGAWRLQTSFALAGTAKAAAYWRHLNEIALDAFTDAVGGAESRINSTFIALNRSLDEATDGVRASLLMEDVAPAPGARASAVQIIRPDSTRG